jgi:DNA modification methylase
MSIITTAYTGTNADLFPEVFKMHVEDGSTIADVTYGKGVFWKKIDKALYEVLESDLMTGVDFTNLPYQDRSIDVLILDPPYMHGGATVKESINKCYQNKNDSHESVVRLYAGGILESARVLKKKGKIIVKTQDEIESGKQRMTHIEIINLLELFGYSVIDLFILVQSTVPAMRVNYQKTARKNHSYAIIAEFRR